MSQENNTNDQGAQDLLQLQLSGGQRQALTKMLPKGYSLEAYIKPKKESSHKPSKKLFTNEGTAIKKNNSSGAYNQGIPTPNSTHSDGVTPTAKRVLREKKKTHSYHEDNFIEAALPPLPTTSSKPVKAANTADVKQKALGLIGKLKKHNCVGPFLFPVDVKGLGLYDYYDYVPEPMDLSTVEKKLKNGEYSTMHEFAADVKKIWSNAMAYNAEGSSIYSMTLKISSYFDRIYREVEDVQPTDKVKDLEEKVKNLTKVLTELSTGVRPAPVVATSAKPANRSGGSAVARSPAVGMDKPMTQQEKKVLCEHIKKLPADSLRGVWEIVSKGLPNNQNNREELVFDIDALPVKVTRELEKYVKSKMAPARPSKGKAKEPQAAKHAPATDDYSDAYQYNHPPHQGNGGRGHNGVQTQAAPVQQYTEAPRKVKDDDAESKSSDSSFISDSESGSDDERKHKTKPAQNYLVKQQDLANFQAGGHGSMLNSFVIK